MKTISIPFHSSWVTEEAQIELEKNLSNLHPIKDFVFTEEDRLEVTFNEKEDSQHINNLVSLQIQYAMYTSGRSRGYETSKSLIFK